AAQRRDLVPHERRHLQRGARAKVVEPGQRGEQVQLGLGGIGVVRNEVGRLVAVPVGPSHGARRRRRQRRQRRQRRIDGNLVVALPVRPQQLEAVGGAQAVFDAQEGVPLVQPVVQDGGRGRRIQPAQGGADA